MHEHIGTLIEGTLTQPIHFLHIYFTYIKQSSKLCLAKESENKQHLPVSDSTTTVSNIEHLT